MKKKNFFYVPKGRVGCGATLGIREGLKKLGMDARLVSGGQNKRRGEGEEAGWVELFAPRVIGDERDRE